MCVELNYYKFEEGTQAAAELVVTKSCKKLVVQLHHEGRLQCIVNWHRAILGEKITKEDARTMQLTRDEYIQVAIEPFHGFVFIMSYYNLIIPWCLCLFMCR